MDWLLHLIYGTVVLKIVFQLCLVILLFFFEKISSLGWNAECVKQLSGVTTTFHNKCANLLLQFKAVLREY